MEVVQQASKIHKKTTRARRRIDLSKAEEEAIKNYISKWRNTSNGKTNWEYAFGGDHEVD